MNEAGYVSSLGTWLGILSIPVTGYIVQKWGHANTVIVATLLGGALVCLLIAQANAWMVLFLVFSVVAWAPAGPIFTLPVAHLNADNRAIGMGIFLSYYYLGVGLFPSLAGWLRDSTENPASAILFAGALFVLGTVFFGLLRWFERKG